MQDIKTDPELLELLRRSSELVKQMTPEERAEMFRLQAESWARGEAPCEHGNEWDECRECWEAVHANANG